MDARLERLERRCRKLTVGVVALTAILATACLSSAMRGAPDVLRARRIEVLGDDGNSRIVMVGSTRIPSGSDRGPQIELSTADGGASSYWDLEPAFDHEDRTWLSGGHFYIGAGHGLSGVTLWTNDRRSGVRVHGGHQQIGLEAEAQRTSLRILETNPEAEKDEDLLRVSLEVVNGVPALRAVDTDGETVFEQP